MEYTIKQQDKFRYIEEGQGEPLVLLHGLFGAMSNFADPDRILSGITTKSVVPFIASV